MESAHRRLDSAPPSGDGESDASASPPKRFSKTAELSTPDIYHRRKRNVLLFCSVVILITLTKPVGDIPIPLLGGEVKLPVELAFIACILVACYFAWEFYTDWETARRRNAEMASAEGKEGKELGSELERLIEVLSARFETSAKHATSMVHSLAKSAGAGNALPEHEALSTLTTALSHVAKELPRWRKSAEALVGSYRRLHESVSRLQKTNFYIDLVVATALAATCITMSGYIVLLSFR